jgi:hypothetical protein
VGDLQNQTEAVHSSRPRSSMTCPDDGSATKSVQGRITFGVSRLWTPHVVLICSIYYVSLSPQQHTDQNAFWTLGTYLRVLVGGRMVNAGVALMWIIHLFEAGYTVTLARRYETSLVVGVRLTPTHWT